MREGLPANGTPERAPPDQMFKVTKLMQEGVAKNILGLGSGMARRNRNLDVRSVKSMPLKLLTTDEGVQFFYVSRGCGRFVLGKLMALFSGAGWHCVIGPRT